MNLNRQNTRLYKTIDTSILKIIFQSIIENIQWIRLVSYLSRILYIKYLPKQQTQKKLICNCCKKIFENILILIIHIQIQHSSDKTNVYQVEKYQVNNETLIIYPIKDIDNIKDFITPLTGGGCYLFGSLKYRINMILSKILIKIYKKQTNLNDRIYYHSTDIFRQVGPHSQDQDSQNQIGAVQKQLQQLRIRQFTDVNDIDKKFFIQWNNFVYRYRRQAEIIYPQALSQLLKGFAYHLGSSSPIDARINLVMHLWTLWSLGQVTSQEIIPILDKYDQAKKQNSSTIEAKK